MPSRLNFAESLDFQGAVAAGGNPKVFIDGGATIEELTLNTNLEADEFTLVIEINNEKRVEITGTQMLDREGYDNRSATADQFVLSFSDPLARTLQGEIMSGLVTKPTDRVVISLEIAGAVTPVTPTATLYVETSANRPEEFKLYILPETIPVTKIGENQFANFRRGPAPGRYFIKRVFNYGAITHLEVEQDRKAVFGKRGLPKAVNDGRLKRNGKTVPTSSTCYVYDPNVKQSNTTDLLDTYSVESLRFTFTTSDSNDIEALTEYVQDVRPRQQAAA
ncbi:hypothetical protein GCM10011403_29420 [Pseudohongiella nitratireducens]|uniref:Viral coat protein P2 N-terminal domain-containing protein n=1 Tax=Pseudohongiella nitratireducens TaxID=1768907 RepID=A0A916QNM3_9GAMM|nr:major capsid protein P2 [Pseudohongiella nitratireducens]GFZ83956.1 hypothetical protein GCM10011403_29420 [Pseudohongiella nitratireducens]